MTAMNSLMRAIAASAISRGLDDLTAFVDYALQSQKKLQNG